METTIKKPLSANIAPETRQFLSDKMNAHFRNFGATKEEQKQQYANLGSGTPWGISKQSNTTKARKNKRYSFATLYKFALQGEVSVKSTVDVLHYFGYDYCKKTWAIDGVIKHVDNGN